MKFFLLVVLMWNILDSGWCYGWGWSFWVSRVNIQFQFTIKLIFVINMEYCTDVIVHSPEHKLSLNTSDNNPFCNFSEHKIIQLLLSISQGVCHS